MTMRQDCRHFESRTFPDGDTISKCTLNLAPEAPWRCPPRCQSYERRRVAVNLSHQNIAKDPTTAEPDSLESGSSPVASLLEDVANIVDSAAPAIEEEVRAESRKRGRLARMFRRKSGGGGGGGKKRNNKRKKS